MKKIEKLGKKSKISLKTSEKSGKIKNQKNQKIKFKIFGALFLRRYESNFLFRDEFMMCTNDPEAGINYCSTEILFSRVKNNQIHQKSDLGAVLALEAKRRMRATIFEKNTNF